MNLGDHPELGPTEMKLSYRRIEQDDVGLPETERKSIQRFIAEMERRLKESIQVESNAVNMQLSIIAAGVQDIWTEQHRQLDILSARLSAQESTLQAIESRLSTSWLRRFWSRIRGR